MVVHLLLLKCSTRKTEQEEEPETKRGVISRKTEKEESRRRRIIIRDKGAQKTLVSTESTHRWGKDHCTAGLQFKKTGTDQ